MLNFNPQEKFLGGFLVYMDFYSDICNVVKMKIMKTNVKHLLEYRESDYFNADDYFVMYIPSLKRFWVTKAFNYNGAWFGGNYKLTSVLTCSATDFHGVKVQIENSKGEVVKMMDDKDSCLGVRWAQGTKELPSFWNSINKLIAV